MPQTQYEADDPVVVQITRSQDVQEGDIVLVRDALADKEWQRVTTVTPDESGFAHSVEISSVPLDGRGGPYTWREQQGWPIVVLAERHAQALAEQLEAAVALAGGELRMVPRDTLLDLAGQVRRLGQTGARA